MTEVTTPPPGDRVEPVGLEIEMQRSFLDYAMSVIVSRALPDVRDGLKPVHRRVLYAMYDGGYRPDRGYSKCSRVVGDVMGQYHPHGDSAIYDTLVRLAQPWAMRLPLVDGQGNFGSPGNDPPAAMRYCVVGSTQVQTADGPIAIADIAPDAQPDSDTDIDLKVVGVSGEFVLATKLFHSGRHETFEAVTADGRSLIGTAACENFAVEHDGEHRRQLKHSVHVVLHQQHGVFFLQTADQLDHSRSLLDTESRQWFIEQQQLGFGRQRHGDFQLTLLAVT